MPWTMALANAPNWDTAAMPRPEHRLPMRILITCTRLNVRAGTQMFVRDLARHLQGLGHSVFAFGSNRAR